MSYIDCFLPSLNSLKNKEALLNHDGEIKGKGNIFAIMAVVSHLWTWHLSTFHSIKWVFSLSLSWSTFISHVTPLSLPNNASSIITLCLGIGLVNSMLPSLRSCLPMFKREIVLRFYTCSQNNFFVSITFDSVRWLHYT